MADQDFAWLDEILEELFNQEAQEKGFTFYLKVELSNPGYVGVTLCRMDQERKPLDPVPGHVYKVDTEEFLHRMRTEDEVMHWLRD